MLGVGDKWKGQRGHAIIMVEKHCLVAFLLRLDERSSGWEEFIKGEEPANGGGGEGGRGGVADWWRVAILMDSGQSPAPKLLLPLNDGGLLLFAFGRLGFCFLEMHGWEWFDWLCLGVRISLLVIFITFLFLSLFISLVQFLLFKALVIFQGFSCEVEHRSGNYPLTEEVTDLKVWG